MSFFDVLYFLRRYSQSFTRYLLIIYRNRFLGRLSRCIQLIADKLTV